MKRSLTILVCLVAAVTLHAQTTKQEILDNPVFARGHFSTYPEPTEELTPAPEGYAPVYISHYGRHGSRYHTTRSNHTNAYKTLKEAKEAEMLTSFGKSLYKRVKEMRTDAKGRDGALTDVGEKEHRGIAERMYSNYPEIFADNAVINCRSTESTRCILSMAANNERLKELNPNLRITRTAYEGDEEYLKNEKYQDENSKDMGARKKQILAELDPTDFIKRTFTDDIADILDEKAKQKFMREVFAIYQIAGCTASCGVELDDVFTPEELFYLWNANNEGNYAKCGNSKKHGKGVLKDARPLLKDIVEKSDDALAGNGVSADLRFGHDIAIAPLAALINVNDFGKRAKEDTDAFSVWADFKVMPMGVNIQFIFYRNGEGDVLVKVLYCEKEATLPDLEPVAGPYYKWNDVRNYLLGLVK